MKLKLYIACIALLSIALFTAQRGEFFGQNVVQSGGLVVTGDWTWLQGTSGTITAGGGAFWVQNACGATPTNFCTISLASTTPGSDMVFGLLTVPADTETISSAFTCTALTAGQCDGIHNNVDTCTLGSFAHLSTNDHGDACYVAGGAGGALFVTETWSGTPSSSAPFVEMEEILPPLCNGVRCTSWFDVNVYNFSNSSCASGCTGSSMAITATDGIIGIYDSGGNPPDSFVAPYNNDYVGNMFALDATTAPAYQVTGPSFYTLNQFAFKSQAASFVPTTPLFTWANATTQDPGIILPTRAGLISCAPLCTLTLPKTTSTGHLGVLIGVSIGSAGAISAIANGGTWVIPTAANTCRSLTIGAEFLSCGYVLSSTASATTLAVTVTNNGSYQFAYFDISRSSGSFLLDSQNNFYNGSVASTVAGPTLTMAGPDACFYGWGFAGGSGIEIVQTYYSQPRDANQWEANGGTGSVGMLLNVPSGYPAPTVYLQGTVTTSNSIGICFK